MLPEKRIAVIYGGGGAIGGAVARLPTLSEVAETAAFLASDRPGAMTGAVANLSCGAVVD
jgi:enoyl-[acyl-carrier-protein] reductase (NADH)